MALFDSIKNLFDSEEEIPENKFGVDSEVYKRLGEKGKQVFDEQTKTPVSTPSKEIKPTQTIKAPTKSFSDNAVNPYQWEEAKGIQATPEDYQKNTNTFYVPKEDTRNMWNGVYNTSLKTLDAIFNSSLIGAGINVVKTIPPLVKETTKGIARGINEAPRIRVELDKNPFTKKMMEWSDENVEITAKLFGGEGGIIDIASKPMEYFKNRLEELQNDNSYSMIFAKKALSSAIGLAGSANEGMAFGLRAIEEDGANSEIVSTLAEMLENSSKNIEDWSSQVNYQANSSNPLEMNSKDWVSFIGAVIGSSAPYLLSGGSALFSSVFTTLVGLGEGKEIMGKSDMNVSDQFSKSVLPAVLYSVVENVMGINPRLRGLISSSVGKTALQGFKTGAKQLGKSMLGEGVEELSQSYIMETAKQYYVDKKFDPMQYVTSEKFMDFLGGVIGGGVIDVGLQSINKINRKMVSSKIAKNLEANGYDKNIAKEMSNFLVNNIEENQSQATSQFKKDFKGSIDLTTMTFKAIEAKIEQQKIGIKREEDDAIVKYKEWFGDDLIALRTELKDNPKAVGAYRENLTELLKGREDIGDTLSHESVHKYIDRFTTTEEKQSLFNTAKEVYGDTFTNEQIEEKIAEDFIAYAKARTNKKGKLTISGKIKVFFDKLFMRFNAFVGNSNDIEKLYSNIVTGKAKSMKPNEGNPDTKFRETKYSESTLNIAREYKSLQELLNDKEAHKKFDKEYSEDEKIEIWEEKESNPNTYDVAYTKIDKSKPMYREMDSLYEEAKGKTLEEFLKSTEYQGSSSELYKLEDEDFMMTSSEYKEYSSVDEVKDDIRQLERNLSIYTDDYFEDGAQSIDDIDYDSYDDFYDDTSNDIADLENTIEEITEKINKVENDAIGEWLQINNGWLGNKRTEIRDAILGNKRTGGESWKALLLADNEEEAIDILSRMEVASNRHNQTDYDTISKRNLSDEGVSSLRREFNEGLFDGSLIPNNDKSQLEKIWEEANQQMKEEVNKRVNTGSMVGNATIVNEKPIDVKFRELPNEQQYNSLIKQGLSNKWDAFVFMNFPDLKKEAGGNINKWQELLKDKVKQTSDNREDYIIKEISDSTLKLERKIAFEQGRNEAVLEYDNILEGDTDKRQELLKRVKSGQEEGLSEWINYLKDNNTYTVPFRYFVLNELTKKAKVGDSIVKRDKSTMADFIPLDANVLANWYENQNNADLFNNYGQMLQEATLMSLKHEKGLDNSGIWIKYEKGSDANVMSATVQSTPWCIAGVGTAKQYLDNGDFHIFYTKDSKGNYTIPRVAIRMGGDSVAEIRGVADKQQNMEQSMVAIATDRGKNLNGYDKFRKKDSDMKMLTAIWDKQENKEELTRDEIGFLYEMKSKIEGFGYSKDARIEEIKAKRDAKKDLMKYYNVKSDEIIIGDWNGEDLSKIKVIVGNAYFRGSQVTSLNNLQNIGGSAFFGGSKVISLGNLQSIGDSADFEDSQITSLGNLQSIGGSAYFEGSKVTSLGALQNIGGNAYFGVSKVTSLGNLQSIGGYADFGNSQITSLGALQNIRGSADFEDSQVTSLGNLQNIGGYADFRGSQVTSLGALQNIGGNAYFEDSQVTSLGALQNIGGNADFRGSQVTSLGALQNIGGNADFRNSQVTSLGALQNIGGNAYFKDSQVTSLGALQNIVGSAFFKGSKIISLGNLQSIVGNADFEDSQVISLGNLQSIGGYADFRNSQVTSLGALQNIGGNADFRGSQITSLGNLQSIGGYAFFENKLDLEKQWEDIQAKKNKVKYREIEDDERLNRIYWEEGQERSESKIIEQIEKDNTISYIVDEVQNFHDAESFVNSFKKGGKNDISKPNSVINKVDMDDFADFFLSSQLKPNEKELIAFWETNNKQYLDYQEQTHKEVSNEIKDSDRDIEVVNETVKALQALRKYYPLEKRSDAYDSQDWASTVNYIKSKRSNITNAKDKEHANYIITLDSAISEVYADDKGLDEVGTDAVDNVFNKAVEKLNPVKYMDTGKSKDARQTKSLNMTTSSRRLDGELKKISKMNISDEEKKLLFDEVQAKIKEEERLELEKRNTIIVYKMRGRSYTQGKKITREKYKEQLKEIKNFISKHIEIENNDNLTKSELNKLLAIMRDVKYTPKKLGEIYNKVVEIQEKLQSRKIKKAIVSVLKKTKPKKNKSGYLVGKFGSYYQKKLDTLREEYPKYEKSDDLIALQVYYNDILSNIEHGRIERALYKTNKDADIETDTAIIIDTLKGKMTDKQIQEIEEKELSILNNVVKFFSTADNWSLSFEMILDKLSIYDKTTKEFESPLVRLNDKILMAEEAKAGRVSANREELKTKFKEILGNNKIKLDKKIDVFTGLKDSNGRTYKGNRGKMTQDELAKKYLELKDPTLRPTFEAMGYTQEMIDAINAKIHPKLKEYADYISQTFLPNLYKRINAVYSRTQGVDLPYNQFYIFIQRENIDSKEEKTILEDIQGDFLSKPSAKNPNLILRVNNKNDIKTQGLLAELGNHMTKMEHYIAFEETIRQIDRIFSDQTVQKLINVLHNESALKVIRSFIKDISASKTSGTSIPILDKLRGNVALSRTGLNPRVFLKQTTSFPAFASSIPAKDFAIGMAKLVANPRKAIREMNNSALFKQRGMHIDRDLEEAMVKTLAGNITGKISSKQFLSLLVRAGDKFAVLVGGYPVYNYYKTKTGNDKIASFQLNKVFNRTQQSSLMAYQGQFERVGGSFGKLFTMFFSANKQLTQVMLSNARNFYYGRKSFGQFAKTALIFNIIIPMLYAFISTAGTADEDDYLEAILLSPVLGIFFVNKIAQYIADAYRGRYWADDNLTNLSSITIPLDNILKIVKQLSKDGEMSLYEWFIVSSKAVDLITSYVAGLSTEEFRKVGEGISDSLQGGDKRRALGFSEYYFQDKNTGINSDLEGADRITAELEKLGMKIDAPKNSISGIEVSSEEYKKYKRVSAKVLTDRLNRLMSSKEWDDYSDAEKENLIIKLKDKLRKNIKIKLFPEESQFSLFKKSIQEKTGKTDAEVEKIALRILRKRKKKRKDKEKD